jgi:hypothetical protein
LKSKGRIPLGQIREQLEEAGEAVEQTVRLQCAKLLHAGERRLRRARPRAGPRRQELTRRLAVGVETLSEALAGDDLGLMGESARELRSALRAIAPLTRPEIGAGLAVLGALLVASGGYAWHLWSQRPQWVQLELTAQPQNPALIWLVSGGKIVKQEQYTGAGGGLSVELAPGRYEIYVNRRYTGRVLQVPGETRIKNIPLIQDRTGS